MELRRKVLETGQKNHDRRQIPLGVILDAPEGLLRVQMEMDFMKQYKYYDALCMWMGQSEVWTPEENEYLQKLVEEYLRRWEK